MFDDVPIGTGFLNTGIVLLLKGGDDDVLLPARRLRVRQVPTSAARTCSSARCCVTLMLPTLVLIIPLLLEMRQLGWVNTYQALILPGSIDAFAIFWMRQMIAAVPDELLDAGRVDGAGEFGLFWRIVVPVIRPGLAALAVLTMMNIYNDFVWPVVVASRRTDADPPGRALDAGAEHHRQPDRRRLRDRPGANCWPPARSRMVPLLVIFIAASAALHQRHPRRQREGLTPMSEQQSRPIRIPDLTVPTAVAEYPRPDVDRSRSWLS